jgi:hypothetical protein
VCELSKNRVAHTRQIRVADAMITHAGYDGCGNRLGRRGIGLAQIAVSFLTCGIGVIWPLIDGFMIIAGKARRGGARATRLTRMARTGREGESRPNYRAILTFTGAVRSTGRICP